MSLYDWTIAWAFRWLPHAVAPGLRRVGSPGRRSPVLVTGNFGLTVRRLLRAVKGRDLWVLVVPSSGINVWCASAAGILTHHRVIDSIQSSGLARRVDHREVILPALAAPGVRASAIREGTGFRARFGPVRARDIPAYLHGGMRKSEAMQRFRFDLRHRLEMLVPMNLPFYLLLAVVLALWRPGLLAGASLLFWAAALFLYALAPVLPGKSGWAQALISAGLLAAAWAALDAARFGAPLRHGGWLLGSAGILLVVGFDMAGIATARPSDPERLLHRLGVRSLPPFFSAKDIGVILLDRDRCRGCRTCWEVCPVGVYGELDGDRRTTFRDREACFHCGACVEQCPEGALAIAAAGRPPARGAAGA